MINPSGTEHPSGANKRSYFDVDMNIKSNFRCDKNGHLPIDLNSLPRILKNDSTRQHTSTLKKLIYAFPLLFIPLIPLIDTGCSSSRLTHPQCNEYAVDSSSKNSSNLPDRYFYPADNYFKSTNREVHQFNLTLESINGDTVSVYCQKKPTSSADSIRRISLIGNLSGEDGTLYFDLKCNSTIKYLLDQ